MDTTTNIPSALADLQTLSPVEIRAAFPAHARMENIGLVYTPDGLGHLRDTSARRGHQALCGRELQGAHYSSQQGLTAVQAGGCEQCWDLGKQIAEGLEDERENLRIAQASTRSVAGVLRSLAQHGDGTSRIYD